jgi:CBS domain-containing protein
MDFSGNSLYIESSGLFVVLPYGRGSFPLGSGMSAFPTTKNLQGANMLVKDIMEPITTNWLSPDMTLQDAVCKMEETKWGPFGASVNGMVVLKDGCKLVGVLSLKNVIRAVIPSYMVLDEKLGGFTWDGMIEERTERAKGKKVAEVMSADVMTIAPDASTMRCADIMVEHNLQRIPVVEKSGKVVGIVHIRDMYMAITDLMCGVETV